MERSKSERAKQKSWVEHRRRARESQPERERERERGERAKRETETETERGEKPALRKRESELERTSLRPEGRHSI